MAILTTEILYYYSMGSTGATGASSASNSLGGTISTSQIGTGSNNVWDDVSGSESASGDVEYRCIYVKNTNSSLTLQTAVVWIDGLTSSADTEFDIGLDGAAVGANSTTVVANENTAPGGITFTRPTTKGAGLSIGNIPAGSSKAIWIRRTVNASASVASDSGSIRVEGDTAP